MAMLMANSESVDPDSFIETCVIKEYGVSISRNLKAKKRNGREFPISLKLKEMVLEGERYSHLIYSFFVAKIRKL